ncbi:DUF427 domain-containing protein [Streptomyces oryzae]|uniref:DUF427 domain-containing protein n=1 Tax=Streptomyces oryzae TaxID=1434886 RepID=A0ABS3XG64_9ACTN|nr:DUF427 domain-containing protein [Streptomyces oryzae]MBO8194369.1 DUF427 domain-containing protein [Streptomyces oryzae]
MTAQGHTITIEEGAERVRVVTRDGRVLAESRRPMLLSETGYPVRYYLPVEDIRTDLLTKSDTHTRCPFKGTADYWSLADGSAHDIAWSYPEPLDQVSEIKGRICFPDIQVG